MNENGSTSQASKEPVQGKHPYFTITKVVTDVFQPNMPPACFAVYSVLARRDNMTANPNNSMRELAKAAKVSPATATRAIETLVHLGLIVRSRRGGSQPDSYVLLDVREAAQKWGAEYDKRTVSFSLSPDNIERLRSSVAALAAKQRGVENVTKTPSSVSPTLRHSFREKRQRVRRETQAAIPLIQEERSIEEVPSPTPSMSGGGEEKAKTLPDREKQDAALKSARDCFTGVIDDLAKALLDINKPQAQHLVNGAADWEEFMFNSLGVTASEGCGDIVLLTLCADDPAAARRGLEKYRARWQTACRKWFGCEVEIQCVKRERGKNAPNC